MAHKSIQRSPPFNPSGSREANRQDAANARIHRLVHYDTLTGLPNLAHIEGVTRKIIESARRAGSGFTAIVLNLDDFRLVDEGYGRAVSDEMLRQFALGIAAVIGEHDGAARVGANEFLVILPRVASIEGAESIATRLLESVTTPRKLPGQRIQITASAGIAIYPGNGEDFETLVRHATAAMHESKVLCPGGCKIYVGEVEQGARRRLQLTSDLRRAIEHHELSIHYQPQYEIDSGRACGIEALARWFLPGGASIAPVHFIPRAEQTGLIAALGAWVLQRACGTVASWPANFQKPTILCVNVSSRQICHEFTATLERTLAHTGFPATRLELEITEGALIENPELALACFQQWKAIGVRIAIDDFGVGYSGLSYLSRFPADRLKIDKSLVHRMTADRKTAGIVRAVIQLGADLGFAVLAEGVETEGQFSLLADMRCPQAQGYLFARPAGAAAARRLMGSKWGARFSDESFASRSALVAALAS